VRIGVFGNLTLDELHQNGRRVVRPGGSALYSSLAAAYLGASVSVVSNIGCDYPSNVLSWIKQRGIDVTGVKKFDGLTTRFRISYRGDSRRLELIHRGHKLKPGSIRSSFRSIHIGPVFMETGFDTLSYACRHSRFLSLDLQGLLRATGQRGLVRLVRRRIDPFLSKCNLVKATEEEIHAMAPGKTLIFTAKRFLHKGAQYVIVTRGRSGSLLVRKEGGALEIPSFPASRVVDMTGAGDIFIGSWLATFLSVGDASWAGAVGAAFASLSIQGVGVSKFRFARGELFRRASWVYRNSKLVEG
jgi:sugar/nucleoside kinase (ribokinase family)